MRVGTAGVCALPLGVPGAVSQFSDDPANRRETCELLSQGRYVNAPLDVLEKSLTGTLQFSSDEKPRAAPDYNVFQRYAANFPWRSHALWFLSQMLRWGQVDGAIKPETIARAVYRPEVFRAAADALGLAYPEVDYKREGQHQAGWALMCGEDALEMGPDLFMDGRQFDADQLQEYLEGFAISRAPAGCPGPDASGAGEAQTA